MVLSMSSFQHDSCRTTVPHKVALQMRLFDHMLLQL